MQCNCSNDYCWSKIPAGAVSSYDSDNLPAYINVIKKHNTMFVPKRITKLIPYSEWIEICENMGCDKDGIRWVPFVPTKK